MEPLCIVGAGGIGCAVGYALLQAGAEVTFVDADLDKIDWGRAHGVRVDALPELPAPFVPFDDWRPAPHGTVLLCTKCYDNEAVLERLPETTTFLPIQNGFDPALEERGAGVEGIASFVSECLPGRTHTRLTRPGKLHLGPRGQTVGGWAAAGLIPLLRSATLFRVVEVPDILPYKYTKLMYNAAISPLASAAGIDNGQLLARPQARRLFFALLQENYTILRGAGIQLGKVGPFHPATVAWILRHLTVSRALAWVFYPSLRNTYCSMARDLPAGRTEIDYYNGRLIELAGDRPCPLNRRLYEVVKHMERERLSPSPAVFEELLTEPVAV